MEKKEYDSVRLEKPLKKLLKETAKTYNVGVNVFLWSVLTTDPLCAFCGQPEKAHPIGFHKYIPRKH